MYKSFLLNIKKLVIFLIYTLKKTIYQGKMLSFINLKYYYILRVFIVLLLFLIISSSFYLLYFYITGLFNLKKYKDGKTSPKVIAKSIDIDFNPSWINNSTNSGFAPNLFILIKVTIALKA